MTLPTQPLRDEHRSLLPRIERLQATADAIGLGSPESMQGRIEEEAYDFLVGHVIPHAQAEDDVLYPAVARLLGAPEATATMSRDHTEIATLVHELGLARALPATAERDRALRRLLYGLHAILRLHFAKEEEIYLPLLDARLSAAEARDLFMRMERVGGGD